MINFKNIEDNVIIICSNANKTVLVKKLMDEAPLKHVKFMSKKELIDGCYFTYDLDAINYVSEKYNYSLELAKEILENLKGIKKYNEKLDMLFLIYNDLLDNNYLDFNEDFKKLFNNYKVLIYGYSKNDIELSTALDKINVKYSYIEEELNNNYKPVVYKFNEMEQELTFVLNNICELINKGISLNNIYLYNIPSEYDLLIKKYFIYHNIPFENNDSVKLYETTIYKDYLELLKEYDYNDAYDKLKEKTKHDEFDALGKIVDIVIKVNELNIDKDKQIEVLNYLAKNTNLKAVHYKESIKVCSSSSIMTDNDYVFMLGFSLGNYPVIEKDTDFYLDKEKEVLNKNTSIINNKINEEDLIRFISNTKNLIITFKEKVGKTIYYPSILIKKLNLEIKDMELNNIRYSKELSKKEVASYYDMEKLYGIKNKWINTYKKDELLYGCFNHEFKGLKHYNNDRPIVLSYSQINEFNHCPFNYFINRILKCNIFDGNFSTSLGTLYHQILEDAVSKEINMDDYNEYIEENFKTYKEKYFVKKLLPQVFDVINLNKDFLDKSYFDKVYAEKRFDYIFDDKTSLMGKIDKVVCDEENKNLIVVDYKTGDFKFKKEKTQYGLDMQLPIYALLLKENYKDYKNAGMYIQNVCLDKDELEKNQVYTLNGITLADEEMYQRLDPELGKLTDDEGNIIGKSRFIKGLSIRKDGKYGANRNAYSEEVFDELIKTAREQTELVIERIRKGDYVIAPVRFIGERDSACTYCKNRDICFMKDEDMRRINLKDTNTEEEE